MPFHRYLQRWLGGYAAHLGRRLTRREPNGPRHVLFAVCDHFEPLWGDASIERGRERVEFWTEAYSRALGEFRDADGRPPRHSFFFPGEQYRPEYLEGLGHLVARGFGEVEVHLHHDGDDADKLRRDLDAYLAAYGEHGHISRDATGRPRYAFIHGNWCLANSRYDGRYCGVDSELEVLFGTGCYADFTFPSAPDQTQPNIVNRIYWPLGDPKRARAHESGEPARVGAVRNDRILMIQGPLALARRGRGLAPRIESAALSARDPGTLERLRTWVAQRIHVEGRPEWVFVKVHTHGAPETQAQALLGEPGRELHRALGRHFNDGKRFILHYVSAREMYNIALAAMHGLCGDPDRYRNHHLPPPARAA
jgi:hypothetical protein